MRRLSDVSCLTRGSSFTHSTGGSGVQQPQPQDWVSLPPSAKCRGVAGCGHGTWLVQLTRLYSPLQRTQHIPACWTLQVLPEELRGLTLGPMVGRHVWHKPRRAT